jgi:hypothetical protein
MDILLVISRYNEDLQWLKEEPFNKYPSICYNKGVNDIFYKPDNMTVIKLDNVGRCDHTYIYHIIHNYDNLTEYTMFLPGSLDIEFKKKKAVKWINEIENKSSFVFIGYKGTIDYGFYLDKWIASNNKNKQENSEENLQKSEIRPYGKWYETFFGNIPDSYYFTLGEVIGVDKEHILSRPKEEYEIFEEQLNQHSNPEVGHYFERSWGTIFNIDNNVPFIQE